MLCVQTSRDTSELIVQFSRVLLVLVTSGLVHTCHKSHNYVVRTCNKCHISVNNVFVHVARIRSVNKHKSYKCVVQTGHESPKRVIHTCQNLHKCVVRIDH